MSTRPPAHAVSNRDLVGLRPTGSKHVIHIPHFLKIRPMEASCTTLQPPLTYSHSNRIQYARACIILGALKCTPNYLLEAEANLIPLALCRDEMLLPYSTRVSTIPCHPVTKLVQSYHLFQEFVSSQFKLSAIGHLHDMKQNLPPPSSPPLPTIPLRHRLITFSLPVRSTLCSLAPKHSQTQSQWQAAFKHLCSAQYTAHTHIYTDGSSDGGRRACAVWSPSFTLLSLLPKTCLHHWTLLFSVLSNISQLTPGLYVIFSDSLSAFRALQSPRASSHYLHYWITSAILMLPPNSVILEWIPSREDRQSRKKSTLNSPPLIQSHYHRVPTTSSESTTDNCGSKSGAPTQEHLSCTNQLLAHPNIPTWHAETLCWSPNWDLE